MKPPKMTIQRMNDAWDNPATTGIFTQLQTLSPPWGALNVAATLDLQYHLNRSGKKIVSPLIENYTDNTAKLKSAEKTEVATIVYNIFAEKWTRLYALTQSVYNPINNYDMTESESITITNDVETTRTGTDTVAGTGTDTFTHTGTQGNAHTGTVGVAGTDATMGSAGGSTDSSLYGFNSSTAVDDSRVETTNNVSSSRTTSDTTTYNNTDTRTDNLTDTETRNTTDTTTHNTTDTVDGETHNTRMLSRSGNIGVTTTQQMIQSSVDLANYWNFFTQVMKDIDTILTISTY